MGLFQRFARKVVELGSGSPAARGPRPLALRNFTAAWPSRTTSNWKTLPESSNRELRYALRNLRARSRDLFNNNEYAARFVDLCSQNIVGSEGVICEPSGKDDGGELDRGNNAEIAEAWEAWGRKGVCTVDGLLTWTDAQKLIVETVARDGEMLVRPIIGSAAKNEFGFALQLLEADWLDELYYETNDSSAAGTFMGVEIDNTGRVVAYQILSYNPADYGYAGNAGRTRIPADQIMHIYSPRRPHQRRGVPWMFASMHSLYQLGDFKDSELTATRVAAAKMGFYTQSAEGAAPMPSDDELDDETHEPVMEVEPGIFERLPYGWDVKEVNWNHPNVQFDQFVKSCLRGSAAGVGVSYNELASDLENVNYSSLREGRLQTVDLWRGKQRWFRDWVCQPVFSRWLDMAILTGKVTVPARKADLYRFPRWRTRGWAWIDPEKESNSNRIDLALGLTTRTRVLAEQGLDFEETIEELAQEAKQMLAVGLNPDVSLPGKSASAGVEDTSQGAGDSQGDSQTTKPQASAPPPKQPQTAAAPAKGRK